MTDKFPTNLLYHSEHMWVSPGEDREGAGPRRVGITWTAQDALGDIVYVDAPAPGSPVKAGEPCGELESTKTSSDIIAPVTGTVVETNPRLATEPELINTSPYEDGWIFTVDIDVEPTELLSSNDYAAHNE